MTALMEHANYTVTDTAATAAWMKALFGWHIRWEGGARHEGHSVHVGTQSQYLPLYQPKDKAAPRPDTYPYGSGLNHIAVVVADLDATEAAVRAYGFTPHSHGNYEPGRRFYFRDHDSIEYEVVQYD